MSTPDYKWLMTLEHDDFDGTTWHESSYGGFTDACATCGGRRSQGPSCYGNDGPATIKLGSAPLTLRVGSPRGTASLPSRSTASVYH